MVIGQKGKSGKTQQHQHTDWSGNNTMVLKHTGLWLTIERWADVGGIGNDEVLDSQSFSWASVSEPAESMSSTQYRKREVGTIARWPHAMAC